MVALPIWLRLQNGRWHAWLPGRQASACGTVPAATLRAAPATRTAADLPPEEVAFACRLCLRTVPAAEVSRQPVAARGSSQAQNGTTPSDPTQTADPTALRWLGYLHRHVKRAHLKAAEPDLVAVAALLAEVGPPEDPAAQDVYRQVTTLLLTPVTVRTTDARGRRRTVSTVPGLKAAVQKLPPRAGALTRVANALRTWRAVMGKQDPGRFKPAQVIEVMLQVPVPEAYVTHLKARGFDAMGTMFHPNTLARAKKDGALRGLFKGSDAYWQRTLDQLLIVTE